MLPIVLFVIVLGILYAKKKNVHYALYMLVLRRERSVLVSADASAAERFCMSMLHKVSRSFAGVIANLPEDLRVAISIFYLALRGLDSIEDDMEIAKGPKVKELRTFYKHLYEQGWNETRGWGEKPVEKELLAKFSLVIELFLNLSPAYQRVIARITKEMGDGMAKIIDAEGVKSTDEYDEYCHYVAGLVGIGLSELFAHSGYESDWFLTPEANELSNQMGLFLQKVNITRDYHEDVTQVPAPRIFWPSDVWSKYADDIEDFLEPSRRASAIACLNEMVCNGLQQGPKSLEYMAKLRHPQVFAFCAVPQVMAIATLALIYNNTRVFETTLKIGKGDAAKLFITTKTFEDVKNVFATYARQIRATAVVIHDTETVIACDRIIEQC
mmetsp:Transcript_13559/g.42677  ORF Transcript_13559/g.42677 Transcript_13559/m.42677 type:complete len:384 (-) Transcript_13559:6-1157(-)